MKSNGRTAVRIHLGLVALALCGSWVTPTYAEPPNILLIMCDDMGFSDIGCYGGEVQTPHIDRLAREGMRFTQFYNNAKCTTTRASLLTGLYPRFGRPGHLRENMLTLGEAMKLGGYNTAMIGKWHLLTTHSRDKAVAGSWADRFDKSTHPFYRGFDSFYGLLDGCCNFFQPMRPDPAYKGGAIRNFGHDDRALTEFPDDYYTTDAFTDRAIAAIRQFAGQESPFFIHLCYTAPHYPLHAKVEDVARYRGKYRMGWDELRERRWRRQQELGLASESWKLTDRDSRAYDWATADHDFEDHRMAVYAAMIDSMDQNMGRLLEALEESGEADNTLILFLSDNGGCAEEPGGRNPDQRNPGPADDYVAVGPAWGWAQNAPFRRYKSWLHEGGVTTPLVAWWPGHVPPGVINRDVGHIIDILPTFLELADSKYPAAHNGNELLPLEGHSMLPLLTGESRPSQVQLCWYWSGNRAIRQGRWKLVWDKLVGQWELYDLVADRCETSDLATSQPDRVTQMSQAYAAWATSVEISLR